MLFEFLKRLPKTGVQFFLEVRHPRWFLTGNTRAELFKVLHENNIGAVITDTPGRRDAVHLEFPVRKTFVRFVCLGDNDLDYFRIQQWRLLLRSLFLQGLKEVYFFLHIHHSHGL